MATTVSIIICTHNRAESLKSTLASISEAIVPSNWRVDLLVVDNGSSDHTHAIVSGAVLPNVQVHYIKETKLGLSYARNRGLSETQGECIMFTDDDILVPTNWITAMCDHLLKGGADAVAGGVAFPPHLEIKLSQTPFSLRRSWFASTEELDPIHPSRMVGANMAFHRRVLERVPSFDVELGPGINTSGSGEETMFSMQLVSAGYKLVGALDVVVHHHFDLSRLEMDQLLNAARAMAKTEAFIFHHWKHQEIKFASRHIVLTKLKLLKCRFAYLPKRARVGNYQLKALVAEYNHAFYREYRKQAVRPIKYSQCSNKNTGVQK